MNQLELEVGGHSIQTSCPVMDYIICYCPDMEDVMQDAPIDQPSLFGDA